MRPVHLSCCALSMLLFLSACGSDGPTGVTKNQSPPPFLSAIALEQGPLTNSANGHVYYRLANSSWSSAEETAVRIFGGHLVSIQDAAEDAYVRNNFANSPGVSRVWLGLTDVVTEGEFVWTDGSILAYTQWEPGEPNDSSGEDYVAMYGNNGNWVDVDGTANPLGIGQVFGVVETDAPVDVYVVQGPVVNPANGHTYFRLNNTNWTTARDFAEGVMGGHLARISDEAENTFVRQTFADATSPGRVWLDLSDAETEGTFVDGDGAEPVYTNWDPGEPNDGGDGEDYVGMYSGNGRWVDLRDSADPGVGKIYGVVELEVE